MSDNLASSPIGVFDSGIGGLTVLRTLRERLPNENFLYLGDSARLPYGTKSPEEVVRCTMEIAAKLMENKAKMMVIACNTITAAALPALRAKYPQTPIIGVIEPGSQAACDVSKNGVIAVIATEGTIRGGAYQDTIRKIRPDAQVIGVGCPLFVMLAEEGILDGEIVEAVGRHYLGKIFDKNAKIVPDSLVFGCTHFPPLGPAIVKGLGVSPNQVNPAANTALAAEDALQEHGLLNPQKQPGKSVFWTTAAERERFARVGSILLGAPIAVAEVEQVTLPVLK